MGYGVNLALTPEVRAVTLCSDSGEASPCSTSIYTTSA